MSTSSSKRRYCVRLAMAGCLAAVASGAAQPANEWRVMDGDRIVAFDTESFTHTSVDVAPDGRTLLFDSLGHMYTVPIQGGRATQVTRGGAWHMRPRFSPDGRRIAYVSDSSGRFGLWVARADGTGAVQFSGLDTAGVRHGPTWDAGGGLVGTSQDGDTGVYAWTDPETRHAMMDVPAMQGVRGAYSTDGRYAYYGRKGLFRVTLATGALMRIDDGVSLPAEPTATKVRLSANGDLLAYYVRHATQGAKTADCVLKALRISTKRLVVFEQSRRPCEIYGMEYDIPDYAVMPDGSAIIVNDAQALARYDVDSGKRSAIPVVVPVRRAMAQPPSADRPDAIADAEVQAKVIRWPSITPDGSRVVFSAFSQVYSKSLPEGRIFRLTRGSGFEHAPALSPDGRWVAYATWSDLELGHVMIAPANGGPARQVTREPGRYANPAWSQDGTKLAFIADHDLRSRNGLQPSSGLGVKYPGRGRLVLQWTTVSPVGAAGEIREVTDVVPLHWMVRRFYPVPTFLPGGKRLVVPTNLHAFSERAHPPLAALLSVNLDGTGPAHLARLPNAEEAVVSPDGRHVAIVTQGKLHVAALPSTVDGEAPPLIDIDDATRVPGVDPVHVSWAGRDQLVWAEGTRIQRYQVGTGDADLLATLDLRRRRFRPEQCIAFVHARLITMVGGEVIEDGTLQVCNDRIAALGPSRSISVPHGVRIIDARGSTLVPGLIDTHDHMHNFEFEILPAQDGQYVANLAHGVTTAYDPQTPVLDAAARGELVAIGASIGPRIYGSGPGLNGYERGREAFSHRELPMNTEDDVRAAITARTRYGAGPLKSYNDDSRRRRQWLSSVARKMGVAVTSHPSDFEHALAAVIDGISLEHPPHLGRNIRLGEDVLKFIAASGVGVTIEWIGLGRYAIDAADPKLNRLFPRAMLDRLASNKRGVDKYQDDNARVLARLHQLGGLPTISAHGNSVPGLALHHEMWSLVDAGGMTPHDALRVASLNGAKKIGIGGQTGSLQVGKLADLIVLNSNPLDRIQNSTDIRYVVQGGVIYEATTMTRVWPSKKALQPWRWQKHAPIN